jgi:hypothetical protein
MQKQAASHSSADKKHAIHSITAGAEGQVIDRRTLVGSTPHSKIPSSNLIPETANSNIMFMIFLSPSQVLPQTRPLSLPLTSI